MKGLLCHRATLTSAGTPLVHLLDGLVREPDDRLAEELAGPGWRFAREESLPHFDAGAIHLVTTATLESLATAAGAAVEVERLRPNLLVEANVREESWIGKALEIGTAVLTVTGPTERCAMVNDAQRDLPRRSQLLRTIGRWNALSAGVYADVVRPGRIRVGDAVRYGAEVPARP